MARIDQLLEIMKDLEIPYLFSSFYDSKFMVVANFYETECRRRGYRKKLLSLEQFGEDEVTPPPDSDPREICRVASRLRSKGVLKVKAENYALAEFRYRILWQT